MTFNTPKLIFSFISNLSLVMPLHKPFHMRVNSSPIYFFPEFIIYSSFYRALNRSNHLYFLPKQMTNSLCPTTKSNQLGCLLNNPV